MADYKHDMKRESNIFMKIFISFNYSKVVIAILFISTIVLSGEKYVIGPWPGGMGVCLTAVLNHLNLCELTNRTPVIYWLKDSLYYNHNGFNGSHNVWEYYFEPVSEMTYQRKDHLHHFYAEQYWKFSYYKITEQNRKDAHILINKYIKIKPIVRNKIDNFYEQYIRGKKTVGIHIRGTDKFIEDGRVEAAVMVTEALKYADEETQFLLSTDEQKLLDNMISLLSSLNRKFIYYDCYRSQDGSALHVRKVKPSKAQFGEDVIVEMVLLSKCDALVHTYSNVSSIPLYFNADMPHYAIKAPGRSLITSILA